MQSKTHNKIQKMKKTVFNAVFFFLQLYTIAPISL